MMAVLGRTNNRIACTLISGFTHVPPTSGPNHGMQPAAYGRGLIPNVECPLSSRPAVSSGSTVVIGIGQLSAEPA